MTGNNLIVVGSKNFTKIAAVRQGFEKLTKLNLISEHEITGVEVESGVSAQPYGHQETKLGALNRLNAVKSLYPGAAFWAAIESGVIIEEDGMWEIGYVIVESRERQAIVKTMSLKLDDTLVNLMKEGIEMGVAVNLHYGVEDAKNTTGLLGLLTKGAVGRIEACLPAITTAFSQCIF